MPFTVDPQVGEEVYVLREYRSAHGHVFAMAVSNQAVYLPAQKFVIKGDPYYFKRVPLADVKEVVLKKQKPFGIYSLSAIMVLFGLIMTFLMLMPLLRGESGKVSGWPIAILAGGLVVPFIGKGRKSLHVIMTSGKYKWQPQLSVDKESRNAQSALQTEIITACRRAGIHTAEIE